MSHSCAAPNNCLNKPTDDKQNYNCWASNLHFSFPCKQTKKEGEEKQPINSESVNMTSASNEVNPVDTWMSLTKKKKKPFGTSCAVPCHTFRSHIRKIGQISSLDFCTQGSVFCVPTFSLLLHICQQIADFLFYLSMWAGQNNQERVEKKNNQKRGLKLWICQVCVCSIC